MDSSSHRERACGSHGRSDRAAGEAWKAKFVAPIVLSNWDQCSSWEGFKVSPFTAGARTFSFDANPCDYFQGGKIKATTLSLSVLVAIEMFKFQIIKVHFLQSNNLQDHGLCKHYYMYPDQYE
uniref:Uncharacterized protein n=1 Tax=Zea mays TaxID=4577 RepID=A0A804RHG2_MAIZE